MSVRKRKWTTRSGEAKEAWIVDYFDGQGARHIQTFERKKDADAERGQGQGGRAASASTPRRPSPSPWRSGGGLDRLRRAGRRERRTIQGYRQHVDMHIIPRLGAEACEADDAAHQQVPRRPAGGYVAAAGEKGARQPQGYCSRTRKRRGNVAQNVARDVSIGIDKRDKRKLKVGIDIPTRDEIRRILDAAPGGRGRALLIVAAFTGLRASELRGLRWEDVDLKHGELHVRQRADRYQRHRQAEVGSRASAPSRSARWSRTRCGSGSWPARRARPRAGVPDRQGAGRAPQNIVRALAPVLVAAGLTDKEGKPKYTGLHALRHFYASWCINRRADGGLELPAKVVQARLGHASIVMTLDRYGHIFPTKDDGAELAEAERAVFATQVRHTTA